ncbi:hypothetical protein [Pelagibacterium lacus]|uniref:hypothetical protein n=1 Tax=Pelagibacterium lacus TaxID=2282655 RepID=UPI001FE3111E|nr:hypothetical protein [Pelagibacterium lacus]
MRKAQVNPVEVIAAWLAIEAMIEADPHPEHKEFQLVQAAKLVHRMASGSHRRWQGPDGGTIEMHVYPRPRGKVLRHLGRDIEEAAGLVIVGR